MAQNNVDTNTDELDKLESDILAQEAKNKALQARFEQGLESVEQAPIAGFEPSSFVEKVAGFLPAATRAATTGLATGGIPSAYRGVKDIISADFEPKMAITGEEQAALLGISPEKNIPLGRFIHSVPAVVPDTQGIITRAAQSVIPPETMVSRAQIAGLAGELAQDVTGPVFKGLGKAASAVGKLGPVERAITNAANELRSVAEPATKQLKRFQPAIRKGLESDITLANRIDPSGELSKNLQSIESFRYGERTPVSQSAAAFRQSLGGEKLRILERADEQILSKVDDLQEGIAATGSKPDQVERIGQVFKTVPSELETGASIRAGYQAAVDDLFNKATIRYSNVIQNSKLRNPNFASALTDANREQIRQSFKTLRTSIDSALESIRRKGLSENPSVVAEAKFERQVIDNILVAVKNNDFEKLVLNMQEFGQSAYGGKKINYYFGEQGAQFAAMSRETTKSLYKGLKQYISDHVDIVAPGLKPELDYANKLQSEFFKRSNAVAKIIGDEAKISPEQVYKRLIASGDSNKIAAVQDILLEAAKSDNAKIADDATIALSNIRNLFLDSLKKQTQKDVLEGGIAYKATLKNVENAKNERIASILFADKDLKSLYDDYKGLIRIGANIGTFEFNKSATAVVGTMQSIKKAIVAPIVNKFAREAVEMAAARSRHADKSYFDLLDLKARNMEPDWIIDTLLKESKNSPATMQALKIKGARELSDSILSGAQYVLSKMKTGDISSSSFPALVNQIDEMGRVVSPSRPDLGFGSRYDTLSKVMTVYRNHQKAVSGDDKSPAIPAIKVVNDISNPTPEDIANIQALMKIIDDSKANQFLKSRAKALLQNNGVLPNPGLFELPTFSQGRMQIGDPRKRIAAEAAKRAATAPAPRPEVQEAKPKR